MYSLRTTSSKNQWLITLGALALTSLISSTGMATPQQPLDIKRGFGAAGAMVFTVASGTNTTCQGKKRYMPPRIIELEDSNKAINGGNVARLNENTTGVIGTGS